MISMRELGATPFPQEYDLLSSSENSHKTSLQKEKSLYPRYDCGKYPINDES